MSDQEDVKRNADLMRATLNVVEVILPFSPADRLRILASAVVMGGCKAILLADMEDAVKRDPAIKDLLNKIRPMG